MATIGIIALLIIIGDALRPPTYEAFIKTNLVCRINDWSSSLDPSGQTRRLYQKFPDLPFLQREVAQLDVIDPSSLETAIFSFETKPALSDTERAICVQLLALYRNAP